MSNAELKDLLEKYLGGRMTREERRRLQELGQSEQNRELLAEIVGSVLQQDRYREKSGIDRSEAFDYVLKEAEQRLAAENRKTPVMLLRRRLAVAAVLLIVLSGGMTLWLRHSGHTGNKRDLTARVTATHALTPGGKRAVLTLSDGSTIVLDSARNGTLGNQGNTRIVQVASGHLAYQAIADKVVITAGDSPLRYNTITTPRGGEYQVLLPDSSIVWLNSASSLKFPVVFARGSRRVVLTGEAYFEISKNAKAPFIVEVEGMRVDVLGTHFNVMAYPDEDALKTTVAEGSVKVSMGKAGPLVFPSQQASFPRDGTPFAVSSPDMEEVLAWKEGKFRFRKTDIRTIMRQIARWYDVDIEYKGELSGIKLYGTMSRKENAAQLFELLEQTGRVHFSTEGTRVTVMPAAP